MPKSKQKAIKIEKEKDPNHRLLDEEAIYKKEAKKLWSVKNIVLLFVFLAISIAIVVLTILYVVKIDFSRLYETLKLGFAQQLGALWFILLIVYFLYCIFLNYGVFWLRLRKLGFKIPMWEYWLYGFAFAFLRAVLPPLVADPYTIFWLKTKGVSTSRATSLMFSSTLFWQFIQFTVTLPSFIAVCINYNVLASTPEGLWSFIFLCLGISIDVCCIALMFLLCWSRNVHYNFSRIFNWFKKKLHMKYHTKQQIRDKYKNKAVIRNHFIEYMKDWKTTLCVLAAYTINECLVYFAITWAMYFVQFRTHPLMSGVLIVVGFDFGWAFHCVNVTFTANRLNFITPGGEGLIQWLLQTFLMSLSKWNVTSEGSPVTDPIVINDVTKWTTDDAIFVWRIFGSYLAAFIGFFGLLGLTGKQIHRFKKTRTIVGKNG